MPIVVPTADDLWQGDIFQLTPWVVAKGLDFVQPTGNALKPYVSVPPPDRGTRSHLVTTSGRDLGMMITHECLIDKKGAAPWTFARILPMETFKPEQQVHIRSGANLQTFFLPATDGLLKESYVDFRLITAIDPKLGSSFQRIASLSEEGRNALRFQLIRYWTRHEA